MIRPPPHRALLAITMVIAGAAAGSWGEELVSGQLAIRGAVLRVSPERQDIDPGRPTVVHTALGDLRPDQIPSGLQVVGDLSGPGLDLPLRLSTSPGDPFRIPGLNREGAYTLSGIRLMEGERTVSAAVPEAVEIVVHRLVISSITSRALTPDEMDAYGIVIDSDNYTAWHYTVGFQIEGGTVEVPFDLLVGPQGMTLLDQPGEYSMPVPRPDLPEVPVPTVNSAALEPLPSSLPDLSGRDLETVLSTPIPGFIVIPTDIAFLNQFFAVIMVVQNGALAGSGLELHDLAGVLELSGDGLRQAETQPPTIPGEAVPVLDPGPDGEPGTGDDLTFIVAQASGQATWLVEGLREGQHRLTAHLTGEIRGLASGRPVPVEGRIPGVVVVRDPRFALTFFHPNVVRTGERYEFRVSVTNTSTTPVYDLTLELPTNAISGARLVAAGDDPADWIDEGQNLPVQRVPELLPGSTSMVRWTLESRRTGRVVASAFNSSNPIDARFVFEIGVGELGIPLSPESIVLPPVVDLLPAETVLEPALELLGLAHSLATAPNGVEVDLPPVGETVVMLRGVELAAAGQRVAFGEPLDRAVVGFGLEWMGSRQWSSSFDVLRRRSRRGHELDNAVAAHLGNRMDELGASDALAELEELAVTGRPMLLAFARGAGYGNDARLVLVGSNSGRTAAGQRADVDLFSRALEGATLLGVEAGAWSGEIGVVAVPLADDGSWQEAGYQVHLWGTASGDIDLEIIIVLPDGSTRRFAAPEAIETRNGSLAVLDVGPELETSVLWLDTDGDGFNIGREEIDVEVGEVPAPSVIAARFEHAVNPVRSGPYRNVILLLSRPVDGEALSALPSEGWQLDSELTLAGDDGATLVSSRARSGRSFRLQLDPRIVVATFATPLNRHAAMSLSSGGTPLVMVDGAELDIFGLSLVTGEGLESGAVRGVVLGPEGGPLEGALVELYEELELCDPIQGCSWFPSLADRVRSDAAGGFVFDAVRYRDQVIPTREAAFTVRAVDQTTGHETRLTARLQGDGRVRPLTLAMVGRGDVVGTLRNEDGSPLQDPLVVARSIATPSEGAQTVPDGAGRFRLTDLPVGPVQLVARDGQRYTSGTVRIPAPGSEATIDLMLLELGQPLAAVRGSVVDGASAEPIPGLDVYVTPAGFEGPTHAATTDDIGAFAMADVPPGVARFKAWNPALGRYVAEAVAELRGDATTTVELVVQESATGAITGTVTLVAGGSEAPVAGAYVVARNHGVFTLTGADGRYELMEIPLGRVELEVWDPVTAAAASRTVDLTADGQILVLDFALREDQGLGSVTVNVAESGGVPVVNAEVALARFGSGFEARTGGDGSARIEGVPPGKHDILVRLGSRLARGAVELLYPGHAAAANLLLGPLVNATVRVQAEQTGVGASDVLAPISYRVPGVTSTGRIGLVPEDGWSQCELDNEGVCAIDDIPTHVGSLVATATSGFYGPVSVSRWIDESLPHDLVINFKAPGVIGGRVVRRVDDGVQPIAGAIVELWTQTDSGGLVAQPPVTTREDGAFFFELVRRGSFSLRTYHPSHGAAWLNGTVGPGQVIDNLELVPRGRAAIEGEVALCFAKSAAKAGSQVRVTLRPNGVPRPLISDLEIDDLADRALDVELGDDDRASFAFTGLMVGGWSLSATSALNGSAWLGVSVGPDGSTTVLEDIVCLHPTGSISGSVTLPETGEPAASVTVQLFRGGSPPELLSTETTDENGAYLFADVPVSAHYQTRAFDGATNRGGVSAWTRLCDASDPGYGDSCTREAVLDMSLAPLGRLTGVLRNSDELPVASAQVRLRTSVVLNPGGEIQSFQREWSTFTGADGSFIFDGVPAGTATLTAFDPASPLFAERSLTVDPVTSPTASGVLTLPETADVTVRVLDPSGAEIADAEPVVVFRQRSPDFFREPSGASPTVEHLDYGSTTSFSEVVSDRFKVGACLGSCSGFGVGEILGHGFITALGAAAEGRMPDPPADQVVELTLVGRATVAVTVTQDGGPVDGALVRIAGSGFYGPRDVTTTTASDGAITPVAGLGVGRYTVTAASSSLGGSLDLVIAQEDNGRTIELEIPIELAASADGVVLTPGGEPAVGALVTMSFDGRSFQAVSGDDGSFVFQVLAANHTYRLEATAADGLGRHTLRDIVVGTEAVHLGELRLDEVNPWVASVEPANGAQDADPAADVVVDFSERMRYATLVGDAIRLKEQGSGSVVATTRTVEEVPDPDGDGPLGPFTRVVLSHSNLASERLYVVEVSKAVEDLAGRRPAFDFFTTFRTRDVVPPQVLYVDPAHDGDGVTPVGPDVVPIATCSEPMDPDSLTSQTVQLLDADGRPVEAVLDLQRDGFDIRIRPLSALELDTFYTVILDGVTDEAGLPLPEPYSWTFRVRDIEPPVVTLLPPEGVTVDGDVWTALEGRPLTLRVAVASNDALKRVAITFNGVPAEIVADPSGEYRLEAIVPTGVAEVAVSARAEDVSGNLSAPVSGVITVVDDQPPAGSLTLEPASGVLPNHLLTVILDATDDHGLASATLIASGVAAEWNFELSGIAASQTRDLRIPIDAEPGIQVNVSGEIVDSLGQTTALAPITVAVLVDASAPAVDVRSPDPDEVAEAREEVVFVVDLEDDVTVESVSIEAGGEALSVELEAIEQPGAAWRGRATASWVLPDVNDDTELEWTVTATDRAGNTASANGTVTVTPFGGAGAPQVAFTCPTDGALMPVGYHNVVLSVRATDDEGVARVEFYNGDDAEPFSVTSWTSYWKTRDVSSSPTAVPADAGPATFRVRAYDEGGRWRETSISLDVVEAVELDTAGGNDWPALVDQLVYLQGGELMVDEPRTVAGLIVLEGAKLSHPACEPGGETRLELTVNGPLYLGCGATIDVSGKGYGPGQTAPGATPGGPGWGGSHIGEGSRVWNAGGGAPGSTYGSVTRPLECGAGGTPLGSTVGRRGGGVIRLVADEVRIEGTAAIRANSEGGAGIDGAAGSVWITVGGTISGGGRIEAGGPNLSGEAGGGAVALEYGSISAELLERTLAAGAGGGAGAVFLRDLSAVDAIGELVVDNGANRYRLTVLPSLGSGEAGEGSGGAVLDTGLGAVPAYFVGRWVEVSEGPDGAVRGVWRVASVDGPRLELAGGAAESVEVAPGDAWRGIYRFDAVTVSGGAVLVSDDSIRTAVIEVAAEVRSVRFEGVQVSDVSGRLANVEIDGPLTIGQTAQLGTVRASEVIVGAGAAVFPYSSTVPMELLVTGDVVLGDGAALDATGYGFDDAYPGTIGANTSAGGSHLGYGGSSGGGPTGSTYGSVTQPHEAGSGGQETLGGGVIRIDAANLAMGAGSTITADGETDDSYGRYGGAGGSVWVSLGGDITGAGIISANGGGPGTTLYGYTYSGGGGAVSVECRAIDDGITLEANGADSRPGGAGTVSLRTESHAFGDLKVAAGAQSTSLYTVLPGIGYGEAGEGSHDVVLETGRYREIPLYFEGHWVEIRNPEGILEGRWRIAAVAGTRVTLAPNDGEAVSVNPGDLWQGVYLFDAVTVIAARLTSGDPIVADTVSGTIGPHNDSWPSVNDGAVVITSSAGKYQVEGLAGAVTDPSGIKSARIINLSTGELFGLTVLPNGSFYKTTVRGSAGDPLLLEATDAHMSPLTSGYRIGAIPSNSSPPLFDWNLIGFVLDDNDGSLHLVGTDGALFDEDLPIHLTATNLRTGMTWSAEVGASGAFDLVVDGVRKDVFELVASDSHIEPMTSEPLTIIVPTLETVFITFNADSYTILEGAGALTASVKLSIDTTETITVRVRTVSDTATAEEDYGFFDETIVFDPEETELRVAVPIVQDTDIEGPETFRLQLLEPTGAELGWPLDAEVTILDDDFETVPVAYSVRVGSGNMLPAPVTVDIIDGIATFAEDLPPGPDRGDRVSIEGYDEVFIQQCLDDRVCRVSNALGRLPDDVAGATVTDITPAFGSLASAAVGAADPDHLGSLDLTATGVTLELVCYAGPPDTTPVVLEGWTTTAENRIRIVAPTAAGRRGPSQRHQGAWSDQAYRLMVDGEIAIASRVKHLTVEGLQIRCDGGVYDHLFGLYLQEPEGDLTPIRSPGGSDAKAAINRAEVVDTIIAISGASEYMGEQAGIVAETPVTVRNSIIFETTGTPGSFMTGILANSLVAENNTIVGGGFGTQSGGFATLVNNLAVGQSLAGFYGMFSSASGRNLYTVHEAPASPPPNPPASTIGPVRFRDASVGLVADYHLECGVLEQGAGVSTNLPVVEAAELAPIFDGDPATVLSSGGANPAWVQLEFADPRAVIGTAVELTNADTHRWMVEAAMSATDLEEVTGTYSVLVPEHPADHPERVWEGVGFDEPPEFQVIRLTVWRDDGSDDVHIAEWWLDALNPACGQGHDLGARPDGAFFHDVDSRLRSGLWDIGADQHDDLTAETVADDVEWWEEEGQARVEVTLSEPARAAVSVRYWTVDQSAVAGQDFVHTEGVLEFQPGEFSKIIGVMLFDDGPGEGDEAFDVELADAAGARLKSSRTTVWLREGAAPQRVHFADTVFPVAESDLVVDLPLVREGGLFANLEGTVDASDGSARVAADYSGDPDDNRGIWAPFAFLSGDDQASVRFGIIDDDLAEGEEGFVVRLGLTGDAMPGVPSMGWVRILDDDGVAP